MARVTGNRFRQAAPTWVDSAKALHQRRPNADGAASCRCATRPVLRTRPGYSLRGA